MKKVIAAIISSVIIVPVSLCIASNGGWERWDIR